MHVLKPILLLLCFMGYSAFAQVSPGTPSQPNKPGATTKPKPTTNPKLPGNTNPKEEVDILSFVGPNYTLNYPSDWELDTSGQNSTTMVLFSPEQPAQDDFLQNISLIIQDLAGLDIDMDQYVAITLEQIETVMEGATVVDNTRKSGVKPEFHTMAFTGKQSNLNMYYKQYYYLLNETAYVLSFACLQEGLSAIEETATQILDSFNLETN